MARRVVLITDALDDEATPVASLLRILAEAGAFTEIFTDVRAGLVSAAAGGADLVVVDMDGPAQGGMEPMLQIARVASRLPVLLLSGEDTKARRMWAVEAGILGYVTKPVDGNALARFVAKVLAE